MIDYEKLQAYVAVDNMLSILATIGYSDERDSIIRAEAVERAEALGHAHASYKHEQLMWQTLVTYIDAVHADLKG